MSDEASYARNFGARTAVFANHQASRSAHLQAGVQFVMRGLTTLLALNGGAVIGFAVFVGNLPEGWAACFAFELSWALTLFQCGLVCALLACGFGAASNERHMRAVAARRDIELHILHQVEKVADGDQQEARDLEAEINAASVLEDREGEWGGWWYAAGNVASVASFVATTAAIFVAATMMAALQDPTLCAAPASTS